MKTPLLVTALLLTAAPALAQTAPMEAPPGDPNAQPAGVEAEGKPADDKKKEPGQGDFDAGGQVRLPNGPDEMGEYATFNWVAFDLKGRYYLLDTVTVDGNIPIAIIKPDELPGGAEPEMFGGMSVKLDAKLPKMDKMPGGKYMKDSEVGVSLGLGYMREGAMLLSEKDFPLFLGGFQPGFEGGLITKVKLSTLVDFKLLPSWVYQSGDAESLTAVKIPVSLVLAVGSLAKVSAELGMYTGDDYSGKGKNGGRLQTGAALDLKIGPILTHLGAGAASLLTGGAYPTIRDSVYIDLNVKYAK
jgi:hypothetical protein